MLSAMRNLHNIRPLDRPQIAYHSRARNFRHQKFDIFIEQAKAGRMKMVPVQVRQINVVRLNIVKKIAFDLGKIPPAPPITRPDQPRIEQYRFPLVFN
jgi:hypothetical protein